MALRLLVVVLLVIVSIPFIFGDIPFTSCGGLNVKTVDIKNCTETVCSLNLGHSYEVFVTPDVNVSFPVSDITEDVGIILMNTYFQQTAISLGLVSNTSTDSVNVDPRFDFNVTISDVMLILPANLRVNASYLDSAAIRGTFCVEIYVTLTRV